MSFRGILEILGEMPLHANLEKVRLKEAPLYGVTTTGLTEHADERVCGALQSETQFAADLLICSNGLPERRT